MIRRYVIYSIKRNPLRNMLGILAMTIGLLAVFLLTGIAEGLKSNYLSSINVLGSDFMLIVPIAVNNMFSTARQAIVLPRTTSFSKTDVAKLKSISGVYNVIGIYGGFVTLKYKDKSLNVEVVASNKEAFSIIPALEIEKGRWYEKQNEIILGKNIAEHFNSKIKIGDRLMLNNKSFKVVGILKKTGNSLAKVDDRLFIDEKSGKALFGFKNYNAIMLKINPKELENIERNIDEAFDYKKINNKKTYTIISSSFIQKQVDTVFYAIKLFSLLVGIFSVIVASTGVANIIYASTLERYKEIALLKALGMKNKTIIIIFLLEALVISLIAIIISSLIFIILFSFMHMIKFDLVFSFIGVIATVISTMFFSYYPAKKASELNPAEGVRYE